MLCIVCLVIIVKNALFAKNQHEKRFFSKKMRAVDPVQRIAFVFGCENMEKALANAGNRM